MSGAGAREGQVVCVTGASGYIASWIVKILLERGYTVNATVRQLSDPSKTEHLRSLEGAKERLRLFEADLLEDGSFDTAVDGCDGVFHAASPTVGNPKDIQADLLNPAVKGTLNVLGSCTRVPSVKRVILTSSMAAVLLNDRPKTPDTIVDEHWYSDPGYCEREKLWYCLSKTLAEDAARNYANDKDMDMVIVAPSMVIGPSLQNKITSSVLDIAMYLKGTESYPNISMGWIHVKDVADAHIQAFEIPSACGRYLLAERIAHWSEIVKILQQLYPTYQIPDRCADNEPHMPTYQICKVKVRSLGIDYIPVEVGLKETVEDLKEKNYVKF